jgi:inosine-uridine nucleoside N-ribohydrolase
MTIGRRKLLKGGCAVGAGIALTTAIGAMPIEPASASPVTRKARFTTPGGPRSRVIVSNDLAGDPDGLFATAQAVLSTAASLQGIVGTLTAGQFPTTGAAARKKAEELLNAMGAVGDVPTYAGASAPLTSRTRPQESKGARAIVKEAMRTNTTLPLYVCGGGALTDIASALLLEPAVASKCTLVWIGGGDYPAGGHEYNFDQDPLAAQVVFNDTSVPIWQVNQHAYVQCLVTLTELQLKVRPWGNTGQYLYGQLLNQLVTLSKNHFQVGEAYVLGDSPLVLLTALQNTYDATGSAGTGTSQFTTMYAPRLNEDGTYVAQSSGRQIRVYTSIDTRVMFEDLFAKLQAYAAGV